MDGVPVPVRMDSDGDDVWGIFITDDGRIVTAPVVGPLAGRGLPVRNLPDVLGGPPIVAGVTQIDPVDVWAATFRQLAAEAATATGRRPDAVTVVVPADWGPRRRSLLPEVADRCGLTLQSVVTGPEVLAVSAAAVTPIPVDAFVAVCDLGAAAARVTIMCRSGVERWEQIAVLTDAAAGGDRVTETVGARGSAELEPSSTARPVLVVRHGRWYVTRGDGRELEVAAAEVAEAVAPVAITVDALLFRAVQAAGITMADVAAVVVAGGGAKLPGVLDAMTARGVSPMTVPRPDCAAVLGAARTRAAGDTASSWVPGAGEQPARGLLAALVCAAMTVALLVWAVSSLDLESDYFGFDWTALACTCVSMVVTGVGIGRLAVLHWLTSKPIGGSLPPPRSALTPARMIGAAVAAASIIGLVVSVSVAFAHGVPIGTFVARAFAATIPAAGLGAATAFATARLGFLGQRALRRLRPPPLPIAVGSAAVVMYGYASFSMVADDSVAVARVAGVLVGAAAAALLVTSRVRLWVAVCAGVLAAVVSPPGYGAVGWIWLICLYGWLIRALAGAVADAWSSRSHLAGSVNPGVPATASITADAPPSTAVTRPPSTGLTPATVTVSARRPWADRTGGGQRWVTATPARQLSTATLALIIAAVIGSVIATHLNDPSPQAPVRQLFTALAAQDTALAGRLADCTASPLCDGDALASGYQPPEDVHIGHASTSRTRVDGVIQESAAIDVSYRMPGDGLSVATVIDVQRSGGFGQDWSISGGAYGMLTVVSRSQPSVIAGGVTVATVTTADGPHALPALPGVYRITADPTAGIGADPTDSGTVGAGLLTVPPQQATITGTGGPVVVTLQTTIAPSLAAVVQAQIQADIDECAARTHDILAAGCPFQAPDDRISYHVADDVTWTVTSYPTIKLAIATDPETAGGPITVTTVTPGHVRATWPGSGGGDIDDIVVGGTVATGTDGSPTYQP